MGRPQVGIGQDTTRALHAKSTGRTAEVTVDTCWGVSGLLTSLAGQVKLKWVQARVLGIKVYFGSMTEPETTWASTS